MQEKVEAYLKKAKQRELFRRGLYEKEYFDDDLNTTLKNLDKQRIADSFPDVKYDQSIKKYYTPVYYELTDEEYKLVTNERSENEKIRPSLISIFNWFGIIGLVYTVIAGFMMGGQFVTYDVYGSGQFNWSAALSVWVSGTILSSLMFGLSKIIELLHEINSK